MSKGAEFRFIQSASWLVFGSVASQLINVAAIPATASVFAPSVLGLWAVMQSYTTTASAVAGFRYELALPVAREHEVASVAKLQVLIAALVSLGVVGWFVVDVPVELIPAVNDLGRVAVLLAATVLVGGGAYLQLVQQSCIRNGAFGTLAISRLAAGAGATVAQLALGLLSGGRVAALMVGTSLATLLAGLVGTRSLRDLLRRPVESRGVESLREVAVRYRRFPLFVLPYSLVTLARDRGLLLLLAAYVDLGFVGVVALAQRIVAIPVGLAATSVGPVMHQRLAAASRTVEHESFVTVLLRAMIWIGVPGFLVLGLIAGDVAPLVLGDEWRGVGDVCAVLAISGFTLFMSGVFDRTFDIAGRQSIALWIEGSNSIISIVLAWILLARGVEPVTVLLAFALVNAAHHVVWVVAAWLSLGFSTKALAGFTLHLAGAGALALLLGIVVSALS